MSSSFRTYHSKQSLPPGLMALIIAVLLGAAGIILPCYSYAQSAVSVNQTAPASAETLESGFSVNSAGQGDIPVRFEMKTAVSATGEATTFSLGLQAILEPGWKIYWRSPGDAGLPPVITLNPEMGSEYQLEMSFPVPERFSIFGIDSFGYADEVIFPLSLSGHDSGSPLSFDAGIEGLVCSDICIPFEDRLRLEIPQGALQSAPDAQLIAKAASLVPRLNNPYLDIEHVALSVTEQMLQLELRPAADDTPLPEISDIFIETDLSGVSFSAPEKITSTVYHIPVIAQNPRSLVGMPLTITLKSRTDIAEHSVSRLAETASQLSHPAAPSLKSPQAGFSLSIVMIAFLGGLVLNIMPCVLPVLMLKLHSVLSLRHTSDIRRVRLRLLTGAAGILASFFLLSVGLMAVSLAGQPLGWGVQFQNVIFLSFMAVVMSLFSLTMFDKLVLPVPVFAQRLSQNKNSLSSDFISGFMATLLATPCSAPFVGTAVSFAFTAPPAQMLGILMMMGLGLASPWIVFSVFPQMIYLLPRPGRWMNGVKAVMGIGLGGTVIWLLWLIEMQAGLAALGLLVCVLVGISLCIWFRKTSFAAVMMLGICAVFLPYIVMQNSTSMDKSDGYQQTAELRYQPYRKAVLDDALASQRPVFVDVTAAWCITCQVNKKRVLEHRDVIAAFKQHDVVLIRADWTEANPEIAAFLSSHGRYAIPFNLFYTGSENQPVLLPELLSVEVLLSTLDKVVSAS